MSQTEHGAAQTASRRRRRRRLAVRFAADRGAVLIAGVCVGAAIGLAFGAREARRAPAPQVTVAAAAQPLDCALPIPPRLVQRLRAGEPAVVGVVGDSFGDGIYAALYEQMRGKPVRVLKLSREGTGFTRYQVSNVETAVAERLKAEPLDIAVLVFGANDTEGIWDDEHRHAYVFMTPQWKTVYGARIERVVERLREQGAMVYWVGLPKMRTPKYDADVAQETAFYAGKMRELGVPFFDTRGLSSDAKGEFNIYLPDGPQGTPRVMRANDGIHMNFIGYERLAGPLVERINAYLARAAQAAQLGAPASPPTPAVGGPA